MSKTRVSLTPDQISQKWAQNTKASIPFIQAGIDAVTESPTEKAAQAQDKMLNNLTQAIQSGRWAAGLRKVTLADWKQRTKSKIQTALSAGVDASASKRRDFDQWLVNELNAVLPTIANMPDMTISDSINRVTTYITEMSKRKYKK